jgi:hypothetical protein
MPQSPAFLITILVLNLMTDLCIILIPVPIIIPLRISWGRKFGLLMMFCAGIFVMIAAILRVYFVLAVSLIPHVIFSTHTDLSHSLKREKQPQSGHVEKTSSQSSSAKLRWCAPSSPADSGPTIPVLPPATHRTNDRTETNRSSSQANSRVIQRAHVWDSGR